MNPLIAKIVLGGASSALLGVAAFATAVPAAAATTVPAATAQKAPKHEHHSDRRLILTAVYESEADALGLTPEQLRDDLKAGRSLEDIAKAEGMTKAQVIDKTAAALKPRLDRLVDSKQITRAQADSALDHVRKGHLPGWKGDHHHPKGTASKPTGAAK